MSLFGKDATSFSHLDLGILCHSSLQILSSSVRLDGKRWWTAIFRSLQRCSIGWSTLEKVFVQDIPVLGHIHLSLDCNQSSCPCSWKTPPQHDAATIMLHCWDCIGQVMSSAWFSPHIPLRIKAKKFYLVSSDQRILFVTILESFRCFFMCLALRRGFRRATLP